MEFTHQLKNQILIIEAKGDLLGLQNDVKVLDYISNDLDENINKCIIDISNINYMNSSGLSMLIRILTKMRNRGGDLVLVNPSESVNKLLVITKLNAIFGITKSMEEAEEILRK
jgi:anti-sigma B factor antagonist